MECVRVLLEHGANAHLTDEWGVYPIHLCAGTYGSSESSLRILDLLLEAGHHSDISVPDSEYGKTPLHYAAYYGNTDMCARLLDLGIDINTKDRTGRTAYQSAERQLATQRFLKEKGAEIPDPDSIPPPKPYPTSGLVQSPPAIAMRPPGQLST